MSTTVSSQHLLPSNYDAFHKHANLKASSGHKIPCLGNYPYRTTYSGTNGPYKGQYLGGHRRFPFYQKKQQQTKQQQQIRNDVDETQCPNPLLVKKGFYTFDASSYTTIILYS